MFDEPLTVIDPHLKWKLRSKLKELHYTVGMTMIYVTHDQTEALTFADQVVVMQEGEVVQIGTPVELFERPAHTFVGHFIGSPGMNVLPCEVRGGAAFFRGIAVATDGPVPAVTGATTLELGVRPEFVQVADEGIPVEVVNVFDAGRYRVVEALAGESRIHALVREEAALAPGPTHLRFDPAHTRVYADGWLAGRGRA
jgi:glycerol transport system ATP-binding protein